MSKVYLDLHVIQSVPPSCLNRDDTGSPKTAIYGGVRRARVSSQSWKRAMRLMFKEHFDVSDIGTRTLRVFDLVADEVVALSPPTLTREEAMSKVQEALKDLVKPSKKDANKSEALFFIGNQQAKNIANLIVNDDIDGKERSKAIKQTLKEDNAVDVALFGRMVASAPDLNCDASSQVAHAISTHRADNEFDYFTAIDDCSPEDTAGAGMIGTVEYTSATYYRYATVAAHELFGQLAKDEIALAKAISEFTRAFVKALPTGKQNTFAANTQPDAVAIAVRTDQPLNLVGAFEKPMTGEGFVARSTEALEKYALNAYSDFSNAPEKCFVIGQYMSGLGERRTFDDAFLNELGKIVAAKVKEGA
ncbi:MAG: type I-E CRISPR-associated protein Cas7/Cse4/CasC [Oscillospiraceae bacterium]|nr:type I-E CRISPR-associated protein Cas7/Cse4/CasC [Oscillospiraceae bacterium]